MNPQGTLPRAIGGNWQNKKMTTRETCQSVFWNSDSLVCALSILFFNVRQFDWPWHIVLTKATRDETHLWSISPVNSSAWQHTCMLLTVVESLSWHSFTAYNTIFPKPESQLLVIMASLQKRTVTLASGFPMPVIGLGTYVSHSLNSHLSTL